MRSLALLRVTLGLIILIDIVSRFANFRAHYTSQGILPLRIYLVQPDVSYRLWSLFYMGDTPGFVALLFLVFFLCALAFTVGYRTRWAGWACWIFLVSIQHRNPLIINAGDRYLVLLLFWTGFLPLNGAFSVDSGKGKPGADGWFHWSPAALCYLMQVSFVYWFSSALRPSPDWQVDGSALYYALNLAPIRTAAAPLVLQFGSSALAFFSFAALRLEEMGPLLLLVPSWRVRILAVLMIVSFHFGILLTLSIGIFSLVGMAAPLGLLPSQFWEGAGGRRLQTLMGKPFPKKDASRSRPTGVLRWLPLAALALTLFHLADGLEYADRKTAVTDLARVLSLDQRWGVFSPGPPHQGEWEEVEAVTRAGRRLDPRTGNSPEALRDKHVAPWGMLDTRWTIFQMKMGLRTDLHTKLYLDYLVGAWNEAHPDDPIVAARVTQVVQEIAPDYLLGEEKRRVTAVYP